MDRVSSGALALRKLASDGSARQMVYAGRDAAMIVAVGALVFVVASKPLGIVIGVFGLLLFAVFSLVVLTSGSRLQKAVREPARIRAVVLANRTKRAALARGWVVGVDNRVVTVPFLAADADVVTAAFARTMPALPLLRFDDEVSARDDVKRLTHS